MWFLLKEYCKKITIIISMVEAGRKYVGEPIQV